MISVLIAKVLSTAVCVRLDHHNRGVQLSPLTYQASASNDSPGQCQLEDQHIRHNNRHADLKHEWAHGLTCLLAL